MIHICFLSELKNLVEIDILDQMASLNQDLVNLTRALDLKNKQLNVTLNELKSSQASLIQKEQMAGLGRLAGGMLMKSTTLWV